MIFKATNFVHCGGLLLYVSQASSPLKSAVEFGALLAYNCNQYDSILELHGYDSRSSSCSCSRVSAREQDVASTELNPFAKLLEPRNSTYNNYGPLSSPPAGSMHSRQPSKSSQSSSRSKSRELPPLPDTIAGSRPTPVAPSQSTPRSKRPLPKAPENDAVSIASEYSQHSVATLKASSGQSLMSARGDQREPVHARSISTTRVRKVRFELAGQWRAQLHRGPEDDAASIASDYSQYSVTTIKEAPLLALPAAGTALGGSLSTLRFEAAQERRVSISAVKDLPLEPMPYGLKRLESSTAVRRLPLPGSPTVPFIPISSTPPPPPPVICRPHLLHQPQDSTHHSVLPLQESEEAHPQPTARDASIPAESTSLPVQASTNTDLQLPYPGLAGRDLKSHKKSKQPKSAPPPRRLFPSEVEDLRRGTLKKLFKCGQHSLVKAQDRAEKEWLEGRYIECAERVATDRGRMDAYWTSAAPRYGAVKIHATAVKKVETEVGIAVTVDA
ncbi:hypothetical protein BKA62DRAFT_756898 [Auriculariales sp. MPI-PUGE-AT-0066]|nr:hypothetical protein BKA62DRAFT_756898 [Auriculariales sp. MPI-PUGE-AT-0066]